MNFSLQPEATNGTNGPLVRGTLMALVSAVVASGKRAPFQVGAVVAPKALYAALHVWKLNTGTLDVVIESDNARGFSSPVTKGLEPKPRWRRGAVAKRGNDHACRTLPATYACLSKSSAPALSTQPSIRPCPVSGRGHRAMPFHAGALWRLCEAGLLHQLGRISTRLRGLHQLGGAGPELAAPQLRPRKRRRRLRSPVVDPVRRTTDKTLDAPAVIGAALLPGPSATR